MTKLCNNVNAGTCGTLTRFAVAHHHIDGVNGNADADFAAYAAAFVYVFIHGDSIEENQSYGATTRLLHCISLAKSETSDCIESKTVTEADDWSVYNNCTSACLCDQLASIRGNGETLVAMRTQILISIIWRT